MRSLNTLIDRFGQGRLLIAIAVLSFVFQLLLIRSPVIFGEPYLVAKNIVAGKGFVFAYPMTTAEHVTAYVTPLYVFLQVPFLWSGLGERGIQIFNLLILQAACFYLFRFFRRFLTPQVAVLCYVALSFYVPFWILGYTLEPNTLNILLLALTIDCLYILSISPTMGRWIQLGLLAGIQLLVRPDILLGAACFAIWLLIMNRKRLRGTLRGMAAATAIACLIVAPWTLRNYLTFHRFILVSANSGFNLYVGNNPLATGELSQFPPSESESENNRSKSDEQLIEEASRYKNAIDLDAYQKSLALGWIITHPAQTFSLDMKKVYYHWFGRNDFGTQYHYYEHSLADIYLIVSVLLIALGAVGLVKLRNSRVQSLLVTLFIYSTLVSTIFFVQSRHRALKVDPFLVPLAVIGVCWLAAARSKESLAPSLALKADEY